MSAVDHVPDEPAAEPPSRFRHVVGIAMLALLIAIGVFFSVTALGFGVSAEGTPIGPGAVPAALGVLLVVGSAVLLVGEVRGLRNARAAERTRGVSKEARDLLRSFLVVVCLGVGLALTPVIGMVLGLTVSVALIATVIERLTPLQIVILSLATVAILWVVFGLILDVNFPRSLIGVEQWM